MLFSGTFYLANLRLKEVATDVLITACEPMLIKCQPIIQRYPQPEKEYQSFSLIYNNRSLDLLCKDKDESEAWFVGLKALLARGSNKKLRNEVPREFALSDCPQGQRVIPPSSNIEDTQRAENISQLGKSFADIVSYTSQDSSV